MSNRELWHRWTLIFTKRCMTFVVGKLSFTFDSIFGKRVLKYLGMWGKYGKFRWQVYEYLHNPMENYTFLEWQSFPLSSYLVFKRTTFVIIFSSVLETTGVPVTGTPSISLEFNFIINRWTIYIDGEPSINDVLNRWRTCDRYTCISRTVLSFGRCRVLYCAILSQHNNAVYKRTNVW